MGGGVGENMSEANLYAVLTILAFVAIMPISLAIESPALVSATISSAPALAARTTGLLPHATWPLPSPLEPEASRRMQPGRCSRCEPPPAALWHSPVSVSSNTHTHTHIHIHIHIHILTHRKALAAGFSAKYLWVQSLMAGAFYYLYNEVAFLALSEVADPEHYL